MQTSGSGGKIAYVLAWINWLLSAFCIFSFALALIFALYKVDSNLQNKIYALLILFVVTFFPAVFFFLNGIVLKSKVSAPKDKMEDF